MEGIDPVDDFLFNGGIEEVFDFHVAGFGEGRKSVKAYGLRKKQKIIFIK